MFLTIEHIEKLLLKVLFQSGCSPGNKKDRAKFCEQLHLLQEIYH